MGLGSFIGSIFGGGGGTTVVTTPTQTSTQNIDVSVNPQIAVDLTIPTTNLIETGGLTEAYAQFGSSIEQSQKSIATAIEMSMQATGEQTFLQSKQLEYEKETTEQFFTVGKKLVIGAALAIGAYLYLRFSK